jgi:hypothetical protein
MAEPLSDPRIYFKFQSCGRCFYKPCDGLRYGGVIAGKFLFVHNSHLGLGFFDCPFTVQAFDEVERLTEGLSSSELDSRLSDAYGLMTPAQILQYRMDDYIADYSDFGGRIAFIKALWDDQVISMLRIPLFFTADLKLRKWLYANENLMYSLKKTVVDDGLSGAAATDSMAAKKQTKSAAPEAAAAPENTEDTDPVLTEIEVFVEGEEGPRKVKSGGTLEIVPDLLGGETITCRAVNGVPATWTMDGYHSEVKNGDEVSFQIPGWAKLSKFVWFPHETPKVAKINAKDKHGKQFNASLNIFPGSKENIEIDFLKSPLFNAVQKAFKDFDELLETLTGKSIEIRFLYGKILYSANFQEDPKSRLAFFGYDFQAGLNPIFSIKLKQEFGLARIVPKVIEKYAKFLSFEIAIGGEWNLNGHYAKKGPEEVVPSLNSELKIGIEVTGGAEIKKSLFGNREYVVIDAKLAGASGVTGEVGSLCDNQGLGVTSKIKFDGINLSGSITALDGLFVYKKEIALLDEKILMPEKKIYIIHEQSNPET